MKFGILIKKKVVISDLIVVSTLSGLFGALVMNVFSHILKIFKQTEWDYAHLDASWLLYWFRVKRKTSFLLGQLINASISSAMGVPIFYMFRKTGKNIIFIRESLLVLLCGLYFMYFQVREKCSR